MKNPFIMMGLLRRIKLIFLFFFVYFKPRKRRFQGRKTVNLSIPQSETSSTKLSHIEEFISSSPTYESVPDFQRVQITGDYASGVSHTCRANVPRRTLVAPRRLPSLCRCCLPLLPCFLCNSVLLLNVSDVSVLLHHPTQRPLYPVY